MSELSVVMPVYNESEIISQVIEDWTKALNELRIDFQIHAYNDGSKDNSLEILNQVAEKNDKLVVHDKKNSGHGPTILLGYRENSDSDWIFQIDSDNELKANSFNQLWEKRDGFDFLIGKRIERVSPKPRQIISLISRMVVRMAYGKGIYDVNSPYRLMRSSAFKDFFFQIPDDTFAPNLIISGFVNYKKLKFKEFEVPHQPRKTGEVSINKLKLLKVSLRSMRQTVSFKFKNL